MADKKFRPQPLLFHLYAVKHPLGSHNITSLHMLTCVVYVLMNDSNKFQILIYKRQS
jgi:hypothetical protein